MEITITHNYTSLERQIVKVLAAHPAGKCSFREIVASLRERIVNLPHADEIHAVLSTLVGLGLLQASDDDAFAMNEIGLVAMRPARGAGVSSDDFAPFEGDAEALLPFASDGCDAAHDLTHILRVWRNAKALHAKDGGELRIIMAAVLLHDAINVEKNSPARSKASRLSGELAQALLERRLGWSAEDAGRVRHAVEAHSHSAGIAPETIEAKIVQDADRLDALGMIGVTRCFYVSGRIGRALYDPVKINGGEAPIDDIRFTLDHFDAKLFGLSETMNTAAGKALAEKRTARMRRFHDEFMAEVRGED